MPLRSSDKDGTKDRGGAKSELSETIDLLKRYVLQETVGPLRHVGRTLVFGLAGALLLAVGLVLLDVAVLRALQEETGTTFAGHWTFVPYLLAAALALAFLAMAGLAAARGMSRRDRVGKASPEAGGP